MARFNRSLRRFGSKVALPKAQTDQEIIEDLIFIALMLADEGGF